MNDVDLLLRPLAALVAGGLVGLERSYHGRAAGLRTYALVSFGSALLVALGEHLDAATPGTVPGTSRVIQGIVTGIGFLGAGVIVKEGFSVRGLTTAASIWVVSAIGIVTGAGMYVPSIVATVLTLGALSVLRRVEDRMPAQSFVHCDISFRRDQVPGEAWLRDLVTRHGFTITELSYRLDNVTSEFGYSLVMWSADADAGHNLARDLLALPEINDFRVSPSRD